MTAAPVRELLPARLRALLAPLPGRWREALLVAAATTTALGVSLALQVPSFAAPNVALLALQRTTVCTWRNMVRRLLIVLAAGLFVVPVGGFLVQTPWLLVPVFFLTVAVLTYGVPAARNPVESVLIGFPLIGACFSGTYDVAAIAVSTRDLVAACAIGVVVATVFAEASSRGSPRARLGDALAASFAGVRDRLSSALQAFAGDAEHAPEGEAPVFSDLAGHVQLLDLARQEGMSPTTDRALVTLATAAERIANYAGTLDTLSRQRVGHRYREALRPEIERLAAALGHALDAFVRTAHHLSRRDDTRPLAEEIDWPDLAAEVARLRERQRTLVRSGSTAAVDLAESANLNAALQALSGIADVLHTPPWELRELADHEAIPPPAAWPFSMLPLDRFALRYALQVALGATIALVVGIAAHEPELSTLLWNPMLVAQTSYGATIRKAWLRLGGVVVGGALAILTIVLVFANTGDVAVWLAAFFAVILACQYLVLGAGVSWYGPFQVGVTYIVVLVTAEPTTDVEAALWRAFGTFTGTAILFSVFRLVAPDYAGRQLLARFGDLLRLTLRFLPPAGVPLAAERELVVTRVASSRASADILRLVDEARLEGAASGVDTRAGAEAAGLALRISLRAGIVARGRATVAWPAIDEGLHEALEAVRTAMREHVAFDLALLDARHTMASPGTRAHQAARDEARTCCARQRPDLARPLAALLERVALARKAALNDWPIEAASGFLAEVQHLQRIGDLLPRLDTALEQMVLPEHGASAATMDQAVPPLATGAVR